MSPADRKKILIAAGVAVVAIVVILFFLRGRKPTGTEAGAGSFTTATQDEPQGAEQPAVPAAGEAASPQTQAPAPEGEAQVAAAAGEAKVMLGVVEMGSGPVEPTRPDPFLTFEPPPRPTPPELLISLPPVGLEPGGLRPGGPSDAPRIAGRRVAGLLFDDQAYAILEEEDQTFIVKPGDVVDGVRITAIARDSVYLVDADGRRWAVPLRGLGPSGFGGRVSGMPGMPPAAP